MALTASKSPSGDRARLDDVDAHLVEQDSDLGFSSVMVAPGDLLAVTEVVSKIRTAGPGSGFGHGRVPNDAGSGSWRSPRRVGLTSERCAGYGTLRAAKQQQAGQPGHARCRSPVPCKEAPFRSWPGSIGGGGKIKPETRRRAKPGRRTRATKDNIPCLNDIPKIVHQIETKVNAPSAADQPLMVDLWDSDPSPRRPRASPAAPRLRRSRRSASRRPAGRGRGDGM